MNHSQAYYKALKVLLNLCVTLGVKSSKMELIPSMKYSIFCLFQFHHRDPHLIGMLSSNKLPDDRTLYFGLIADGIHTHPAALRIAYRVHQKGNIHIRASL